MSRIESDQQRARSAGALIFHSLDLDAHAKEGEVGEEGTFPRLAKRFERRRQDLPGTAANGDAVTNASNPTLARQSQSNGKPAQRELG